MNFVKNETLKMSILWKMRQWVIDFCEKWDFEIVNMTQNWEPKWIKKLPMATQRHGLLNHDMLLSLFTSLVCLFSSAPWPPFSRSTILWAEAAGEVIVFVYILLRIDGKNWKMFSAQNRRPEWKSQLGIKWNLMENRSWTEKYVNLNIDMENSPWLREFTYIDKRTK